MFHLYAKNKPKKISPNLLRRLYPQEGFTILEVLAAVAVFSLLLGSVFSLYQFGINTYHNGLTHLDLQQNVRLAGDFISRELRHAVDLQLSGAGEVRYRLPADANNYTLKQKNREIVLLINNTETKIAYDIGTLLFNWDATRKMLYYSIEGTTDRRSYGLRSAVLIHNLRHAW